ncbi:AAA family ATPase [Flavobacterium sp. FlaQc-28]|uniref:AAA family ATPase n=1 Tax=Flavobacterium sp. FlaQc-28 TaxID=3374178 RepID=UPI0037564F58
MTENFITSIYIENSRNIKDFEIPLSSDTRQHLILTGKNGSGKTSLLIEINKFLARIDDGSFNHIASQIDQRKRLEQSLLTSNLSPEGRLSIEQSIKGIQNWFENFGGTKIKFSGSERNIFEKSEKGEFLLAFFDAKRHINLTIPKGINKINLKKKYQLSEKANTNFIQYIVNLKADRSFARDDNEMDIVEKIDKWFERLENRLKQIFDVSNLELKFDRKSYNFEIVTDKSAPFNFNNLSDGYSAIISIVTELLLRMEAHQVKSYDLEGIIIIDEIETHLHVDLQKKILPFLVDFFPKLQFIVTTHSPFVLSSLSNATICDLETKTVTTDLSSYSYDALIESYFRADKYSAELKEKIKTFEILIEKTDRKTEEEIQLKELRNYFAHSPKYLSNELLVKLQQIELKELNK